MRYSGLTGACVNAMSFNNFVAQAVAGVNFADRVRRYALETNWSNGEVVERGTGHNHGTSRFVRHCSLVRALDKTEGRFVFCLPSMHLRLSGLPFSSLS